MSAVEPASVRACPKCEVVNAEHAVIQGEYRCTSCGFELAHLDIAANGAIRGVFGWLRAAGDTIQDRYRVRSVLGKGGFGATYLVDDLRLNGKRRALKEVPELLFDEYETALLSRLQHPSIPDIIDRFTAGGMVYLTLEFGGSRTLASERNRQGGRIPFATLLPWVRQLCMVLTYLHTQDPPIIHRDLKPENILLDEDGRIMLIDFGIAKEATPSAMTRTLGRAATHGFSPPEQVMGTGTDQRSDVYALGATCYALLTGESPPAAHERVAGKELRPPGELSPEIPEGFGAALLQALTLNVNHRQQSVAEFSRMLDGSDPTAAAARTPSASARTTMVGKIPSRPTAKPKSIRIPTAGTAGPQSPPATVPSPGAAPSRMRMAVGIGAATVIAMAGGGYYFWSGSEPSETPPPAPTAIASPVPAPSSPPAALPSVPVPAPAPPNSGAQAVQPPAAAPPLAGQAPVGGESAQSILNNYTGGLPETSPPAAVTPDPPVSAALQAPPVRRSPPPVPTPSASGPSAGGILDDNRGGATQQPRKTPRRITGAGTGTRSRTPKPRSSQPAAAPKPRSSQPAAAPKPAPVWKFDE